MHIKLDDEQWVASEDATLGEVLSELNARAYTKARIVTTMMLDHRRITDRDIDPQFLQEPSARFRDLVATSSTQQDIIEAAREPIRRYCEHVVGEGNQLLSQFRMGMLDVSALDRWLGQVADILELMKNPSVAPPGDSGLDTIASWIEQLLGARQVRDTVHMADLLEYEILPRLLV
ncbi:MAG: hypothetical protein JNN16_16850 [Nitrospira sp.]|nr:hypothetical protein [Nitrospira sp.]